MDSFLGITAHDPVGGLGGLAERRILAVRDLVAQRILAVRDLVAQRILAVRDAGRRRYAAAVQPLQPANGAHAARSR